MSIFNDLSNSKENFEKLFDILPTEIKNHSIRVSKLSKFIFEKCLNENVYEDDYELTMENLEIIQEASKYHDIGKATLDDRVLLSTVQSEETTKYVQSHTTNILEIIDDEFLDKCDNPQLYSLISDIALFHHERWDGRGYPNEYFEESIPICARIVAIANKLDHLLYPQSSDVMMKLEFPFALKEIQGLALSHFDPIIIALLVKYEKELNTLIDEIHLETLTKKQRKQLQRKQKKKSEVATKAVEKIEDTQIVKKSRCGPPVTISLKPAYDVNDKEAVMVTFDLVLNDIELGKIRHEDYFYVAERSNRLLSLIDIELQRMNEYALALEKKKTNCLLDIYVSTKYLKTPNYFQWFIELLQKYPKVRPKLCLTFDGYDFIDGDIELEKIKYLKDIGIKIALDNKDSLYSVPELLSLYNVDYIKLPYKLFKGITAHGKIAFQNTMKTIEEYKVIPIIYDVDNYLQFKKCKELELYRLQGDYLGNEETNRIVNFLKPTSAVWMTNE